MIIGVPKEIKDGEKRVGMTPQGVDALVHWFINSLTYFFSMPLRGLYATTLITEKDVIPAKAGIQENTGFRVKPGMTNHTGPIYHHV